MSHVRTLEAVIFQVRIPFRPKHDPGRNLAEEIECCKRKIWECVDQVERKQYFEKKQKKNEKHNVIVDSNKENSKQSTNKIEHVTKALQKAPTSNNQPPLTRTDIELKVFVMKVVELKKELKARGQDTSGLKKDLRSRLIRAMLEDIKREESRTFVMETMSSNTSDPVSVDESLKEQEEYAESMDISKESREKSETAEEETGSPHLLINDEKSSRENERKESVSSMQVEHHNEALDQANGRRKDDFTEQKHKSGPICESNESLKNPKISLQAIREIDGALDKDGSAKISDGQVECRPIIEEGKSDLTEVKVKNLSDMKKGNGIRGDVSGPPSEVSCSSKVSGNSVKEMVSKFSGFSSSLSSSSSGSALSKGLQAKKEARQAKIAEMRAKAQSKPVTASKVALTSKEYSSTLSSLNATASASSSKKKNLATQMREKAAARAFQNKITNSVSKAGSKTMTMSSSNRHLPLTSSSSHSKNSVPDSLGATLQQPPSIKVAAKVLSPMDTYEISDREDSGTDDSDSDSEYENPKKKIPTWAQRANLYSALEEQYNGRIGSVRVDPDDIFPEVQSCDLEAIFGPKKAKLYKRRASSGNWANDQVTVAEKLIYKREMGFTADATGGTKV